ILLFLLLPAFRLRSRLIEKESFVVIDGSTFWSSRWGKVKVYGVESPEEGKPEYEEAKGLLSDMLNSRSIKIIPIRKDREGRIVAKVLVDGQDLAEKITKRIKGH
ncbi:MAG: thermonuclease family protein, partial [bacterium]